MAARPGLMERTAGMGGHDGHTQASSPATPPRLATRPARVRRARRCRRRSRRSPSTRSCPIATPARWWRPTVPSTGCAFPASTRRACSAPCSTARRGRFRFGPFGINVPSGPPLRARHQRAGDDVEDAAGLGRGARRADDGSEHRPRHRHAPHATARRRRRRAHAGPGRRVPRRTRRDGVGVRAGVRLRAGAGDVVDRRRGRSCRRGDRWRRHDAAAHRPARRASKAAGCGVVTCSRPATALYCALSWAADFAGAGRRRRRRRRGSTRR